MPRGTTPEEVLEKIDWVRLLPDSAWGDGIVKTAEALVKELKEFEEERKAVDDKIKTRLKVLRLIPTRAEREAPWIHDKMTVEGAKEASKPIPDEVAEE